MFNIVASELVVRGGLRGGSWWPTWPSPPWTLLEYGGIALMIVAPFVFFPFSKALFLAFDLLFRPAAHEELARRRRRGPPPVGWSSSFPAAASGAGARTTRARWPSTPTTGRSGSTSATGSRIPTRSPTPRPGWRTVTAAEPETQFAIEVDGEAAGGIGVFLQQDVERYSAEIGYWLGEAHWGRGLATAVGARGSPSSRSRRFELCRIYANVFAWNTGSVRVLEKAGYAFEGRLRNAAVKDGRVVDDLLYAAVREFPFRIGRPIRLPAVPVQLPRLPAIA